MKLRTKIILSLGLVFILFSMVIGVALIGMQSVKGRFESFLQKDLALLQAVTGMYADGLQGGQALRNIVLDPANKTAYKNLEEAGDDFKEEGRKALSLAASEATDRKMLEDFSVTRVTDIMAEITAASQEQSSGIAQVNQAITQMDQVTQQNAALVEEAAAAAASLQEQAGNLSQVVSVFKLDRRQSEMFAQARPSQPKAVVPKRQTKPFKPEVTALPTRRLASAGVGGAWETV